MLHHRLVPAGLAAKLLSMRASEAVEDSVGGHIYRLANCLLALLGLGLFGLAALPVLVILMKLSMPGPVFYRQIRLGYRSRPFELIKLRTMLVQAERDGPRWAQPNDPRVLPLGRWLRNSHLDELPQLWNVIKGDMNIIGPRPERPELVELLRVQIPGYERRHEVRPGITGLAQVRLPYARSIEETRRKLALDLSYIGRRSPALDLWILLRTVWVIMGRVAI